MNESDLTTAELFCKRLCQIYRPVQDNPNHWDDQERVIAFVGYNNCSAINAWLLGLEEAGLAKSDIHLSVKTLLRWLRAGIHEPDQTLYVPESIRTLCADLKSNSDRAFKWAARWNKVVENSKTEPEWVEKQRRWEEESRGQWERDGGVLGLVDALKEKMGRNQ